MLWRGEGEGDSQGGGEQYEAQCFKKYFYEHGLEGLKTGLKNKTEIIEINFARDRRLRLNLKTNGVEFTDSIEMDRILYSEIKILPLPHYLTEFNRADWHPMVGVALQDEVDPCIGVVAF